MTASSLLCLATFIATLFFACGAPSHNCTALTDTGGNGGEPSHEHTAGQFCAPECTLFCGTEQECSLATAGAAP